MSNENKNEKIKEEPFVVNQKNLKNDMIHFKDDVLKDIKYMQKNITEKFEMTNNLIKEKLESYDRKMNLYNEKLAQLSNLVVTDNAMKEKIEQLVQSKVDLRDHILTNEIKFTNLEKEYHEKMEKIDYVLSDSVIYPSVIGPKGKYKTFHDFIDYVLQQLAQTAIFRDKNSFDLSSYKNKLENLIQSFKFQLDNIIKSTNQFTIKSVNECEERVKGMFSLYDERLTEVRVENQNYIKKLEQFYLDLKEEFKKLNHMKNGIYNRFSNEVYNMKRDNVQVVKLFSNYKKEFILMKDRLTQLSEFIRNIRFRINVGQEVKRREFMNMANKIDFTKKQNLDDNVSSGIRKYIKGEINAEELAQTRRFTKANLNLNNNNISNNPMSNNNMNNNNMNNNNKMNNTNMSNTNMSNTNINNYNMNDNMIVTNMNNYNMNSFNFDDEIDDTMANINNYLMKNQQYLEQDFNNFSNNYKNPQKQRQSVTPSDMPNNRRKSVNNLISCISLRNFKRNTQVINQTQNQNMRKTLNFSNNDLKLLNSNINRNAQSTDKGRKRYQNVFNNNNNNNNNSSNNNNFPSIDSRNSINNITLKKSMSMESEDSKNSAERKSYRINNNASNSLQKNIIKEEEELNSKISETESNNNNNSIEEHKIKSNNNKINSKNEVGEKKIIVKNTSNDNPKPSFNSININDNAKINVNNLTPIKSKQNNENEKNVHKPISKISLNNANSMKSLSRPKEQNISNTRKLSDKKINNNIVINCDNKNSQNQAKNKEPIANVISEKKINNNINNNNKVQQQETKLKNEDNSKQNHFDEGSQISNFTQNKYIKPSNSEFNMNFNSRNNISTLRKDNTIMNTQKNNDINNNHLPSFNLISIINYKNSASQSQNKSNNNIAKSKDDKIKFSKTTNSLSPKNEIKTNYIQPPNMDKNNNTISVATEYKSFKGKKLDIGTKSFMAKINESIVPYESQNILNSKNNNNNNKKGILKMKEKIFNSNNNLFFNQEEKKPKHYRNISMDDRNAEAKNLQKMVHDLQSYISNYTSGFEDSNSLNIYKNGQNFIFKDMNNSYYGNNNINNNHNHINNSNKNKNNIFQLKLK